jgi:hypothetical protein
VAAVSENVKAGVVVPVATLVVNRGDRLPDVKLVTVPLPPPPEYCGIFKTPPETVAAPLDPVVVRDEMY